jgi:hypothetical protein
MLARSATAIGVELHTVACVLGALSVGDGDGDDSLRDDCARANGEEDRLLTKRGPATIGRSASVGAARRPAAVLSNVDSTAAVLPNVGSTAGAGARHRAEAECR